MEHDCGLSEDIIASKIEKEIEAMRQSLERIKAWDKIADQIMNYDSK